MNAFRRVLAFLSPYKREVVAALFLMGLTVIADLSIPYLVQVIIDEGVVKKDLEVILRTSLFMILASIMSAALMVGNTIFSVRAARGFEADLRDAIFRKIQTFSFGNLDDFQTGQLLTRLTSDVNQIQLIVNIGLRMFARAPLTFIGSIGIMVTTNPQLTTVMLSLLPVTIILVYVFIRVVQPLFLRVQEKLDGLNQVLQENFSGIRVVKAFVRRDYENLRFEEGNTALTDTSIKVSQALSFFFPLIMVVMNLGAAALLYYGGMMVFAGTASIGQVMAFLNYIFRTMFPVLMLSMTAGQISAANASASRIMEVMDTKPEIVDEPDATIIEDMSGRVVFENVSFSFHDDGGSPVLTDVSFTAEPGETVALLGSTGSGKSSLVHLIPRFYDVTKGRITIDDVDIRNLQITNLRSHIGISLQEAILFSGTIRDNIRYGRSDATDEEVIAAAEAAQAHEFIIGFPKGYDTLVGQRGVNLSGGQKQRVAIARAILVKPAILILDDSTSAVDVETESKIETALKELMQDTTSFVIAQRISTVLTADKIIILDEGRIAAEGNHSHLITTSPIYREIYASQLGDGGHI